MDLSLVDLGKRLLEAAKLGETEEVRILMTNGAPFTTDWLGTSPLHMAAQYGHSETAEVLLRGGISRDARTKVDRTPLHIAAQEGHIEIVRLLIHHGAEVDAKDMLKMTPLHWAVERNRIFVVQLLLKCGAQVDVVSKFDKTPIDIAEDNQYSHMIELLSQPIEPERVKKYLRSKVIQLAQPNNLVPSARAVHTTVPLVLRPEESSTIAVRRTIPQSNSAPSPVIALANPTKMNVAKSSPVFLRTANLANVQKAATHSASVHVSPSSDSEEGESNDTNSSTNVLATLATLAEATLPYPSISSADALKWLELNGITMIPSDNSTIIASALESGQTVSLTEAGKLALTWAKQQQNLNNSPKIVTTTTLKRENIETISEDPTPNQKVITIVADQSRIPSIISTPQTPIVVLSPPVSSNDSCPPAKKLKTITLKGINEGLRNGNAVTSTSEGDENLKLKEELERIRKQAELYKAQLMLKEHEAEQYKKQIERMRAPE